MTFDDVLKTTRAEVLVAFSGAASQADYNLAAQWLSRLCVRELRRREGDQVAEAPALELRDDDLEFAVEWLDFAAGHYSEAGANHGDADLLRLAALLDHVRQVLAQRIAAPLQ